MITVRMSLFNHFLGKFIYICLNIFTKLGHLSTFEIKNSSTKYLNIYNF